MAKNDKFIGKIIQFTAANITRIYHGHLVLILQ